MTTKLTLVVALAALITAAAAPPAAACGFYSEDDAARYTARWMFANGPETRIGDLERRYPELSRRELALLAGPAERTRVRALSIEGTQATALVEVVRRGAAELFEVELAAAEFRFSWQPVSVERASPEARRALALLGSMESVTRALVTSASARLARR